MAPLTLMWDETSTTDNQTRVKATFARKGPRHLSDVPSTFNDRENATKQLQFVGYGGNQQSPQPATPLSLSPSAATPRVSMFACSSGSDNTAPPYAAAVHSLPRIGYSSRLQPLTNGMQEPNRNRIRHHHWRTDARARPHRGGSRRPSGYPRRHTSEVEDCQRFGRQQPHRIEHYRQRFRYCSHS